MEKRQLKVSVLKVMEKASRVEVKKNEEGNVFCGAFFHQPKRPKSNK